MNEIPIYVINLDKDRDRWGLTKSRLLESGCHHPRRISAIYGKDLPDPVVQKYTTPIVNYFGSRSLIGCALSHVKTWKKICQKQHKYAVVLEDDIVVKSQNLNKDIGNIIHNFLPADFDICYLGCHGKCRPDFKYGLLDHYLRFYQVNNGKKINDHVFVPEVASGAYGYMLSNKGANKLLKLIKKIQHPIDMQMSLNFDKLNVYAVNPVLIDYNHEDTSNMMATRPMLDFLAKYTLDGKASLQKNFFYYQYQILGYPMTFWMILLFLVSLLLSYLKIPLQYIVVFYVLLNLKLKPLLLIGDVITMILGYLLGKYLFRK